MAADARATAAVVMLAVHLSYSCWCCWHHHCHVAGRGSIGMRHHCLVVVLLLLQHHHMLLLLLHLHLVMHSWP
jgi:hypothetical protein